MIQNILNVLNVIGDFFIAVGKFLINFITLPIKLYELIGTVPAMLGNLFHWLPMTCISIMGLCLAGAIVYRIFGQGGL